MQTKIKLTDFASKEDIFEIKRIFRQNHGFDIEVVDVNGKELPFDHASRNGNGFCETVNSYAGGRERCRQERVRGLNIAIETRTPYVTICMRHINRLRTDDGRQLPLGGFFTASVCVSQISERPRKMSLKAYKRHCAKSKLLKNSWPNLKIVPTRKFQEASDFLSLSS